MAGINKVILIGNLGKDPEIRYLENGTPVVNFTLATTENFMDKSSGEKKSHTEWHNIVIWRKLAEVANQYLKKGSQIYLEGKLSTRNYQDKDGVTKYSTEVVVQNFTMLGTPKSADSVTEKPKVAESAPSTKDKESEEGLPF